MKSITAKEVFAKCPEIKKKLWGGEFWSDRFYVATVSEHGNEKVIANYVKNQGDEYNKMYRVGDVPPQNILSIEEIKNYIQIQEKYPDYQGFY